LAKRVWAIAQDGTLVRVDRALGDDRDLVDPGFAVLPSAL
jgi:hypothetical protein